MNSKFFKDASTSKSIINLTLVGNRALPCPFCGSAEIELQNTWTAHYSLRCQGCDAEVNDPGGGRNHKLMRNHLASANAALRAWNRRAP